MSRRTAVILGVLAGFVSGNVTGVVLGILTTRAGRAFVADIASDERPADVTRPVLVDRPGFSLSYPGNWKLDEADADFDLDHFFSIDSPGSSSITLVFFDRPTDPAVNVRAQTETHLRMIPDARQTPFSKLGRYDGVGMLLEGKRLGFLQGGVRIFSHSTRVPSADRAAPTPPRAGANGRPSTEDGGGVRAARSFVVVEQYFDEDLAAVQPGFALVEESLHLKD